MTVIAVPNTFTSGAVIVASEHNSNFSTIYNDYNGSITNSNISASAAIVDTKLATISTAGKVNISALTVASQAQGDIIYASGATTWARLGAGTSGQFLKTQGASANPIWADSGSSSGTIIQSVITQSAAVASATGTCVDDDTVPQTGEVTLIAALDRAITASSGSNTLIITATLHLSIDASANYVIMAVFKDAGASAVGAARFLPTGSGTDSPIPVTVQFSISATDTSSHTFKVGVGHVTGGNVTINGQDGSRKLGGVLYSSLRIDEVKA